MALGLKQKQRVGELATPLGEDELVLTRFDGSEGLSTLFTYSIEALSDTEDINFDAALGQKCTVSIKSHDQTRRFNGRLVEADWIGMRESRYCYRLLLRPWLWLLSRQSNCRIFAKMTVPDIITKVFEPHGFAKFEKRLSEGYPKLKHVVQYRETDLNFVLRLMEGSGIYYFFDHTAEEHTLVLADSKSSHKPVPGGGSIPYRPLAGKDQHKDEHLNHWVPGRRFNSGRVVLNDYDYNKPSASLKSESEESGGYENDKLELYDYPGGYFEKSDGDDYAKFRVQAEQASDHRCQAAGNAVNLFPGALVSLSEHPTGSQNQEYLIAQAMHSFSSEQFRSGASADADEVYSGRYEFLPSKYPFRCPMLTPKPVVHGPQTAVVVSESDGDNDGDIDVDKHGCILLKFHWDREHKSSDALRVRVGQVWSGKKWGGIFIPRVGMEVVVEFLEGDPDRPLVVGTVYNEEYMPPYDQEGVEKNIAGWKSRSVKSDSEEDYNEIIFDDTRGKELIRTHAQKDQDETVENDRKIKVGHDHTEDIGNKMKVEAEVEMKLIVGRSSIVMTPESITICSPMITIKADMMLEAKSPLTTVKGDTTLTLKGGLVLIN